MSNGVTHCPYVGLRQNKAIQFSTPTAEHRCYVSGDALDIPVDQASYCLSQFHTQCPLYMGSLSTPKKPESVGTKGRKKAAQEAAFVPAREARDDVFGREDVDDPWQPATVARPAPRPRVPEPAANYTVFYVALVIVLALAGGIYWYASSMLTPDGTALAIDATATTQVLDALPTEIPATAVPTAPPEPSPMPTAAPAVVVVVDTATPQSVATPRPTARTVITFTPSPSSGGNTNTSGGSAPAPTAVDDSKTMQLWLYFGDASGTLIVPVQRSLTVTGKRVAGTAMSALITDGPRNGLQRLVLPDVTLKSLSIKSGTALVDFDKRPTGQGDVRGFAAMTLTLTQFNTIQKVKYLINGADMPPENGISETRPLINVTNPDNLGGDAYPAVLYFVANNGIHDVPVTRMIPKPANVLDATVRAWLAGPGQYAGALKRVVPESVQLRGVALQNGLATIDFTQPFADISDRPAAMRTLVETVTTISGVKSVQVLVEGKLIGQLWGNDYNRTFEARVINPE